jgi:lipopolysaccharide biosynthesis glycosyltransferase
LTFIASLQSRYTNLSIQLHKVNAKRLDGLFSRKYTKITPIGYGRFLFAEVLSALDKVLYLDTDVVCVGDISVLWNTELEGSYAAAVPEYSSWHSTGMTKSKEKARLFIAKENEMINSGVMLFNLDLIRKDGVVSKLFKTDKLIINRMNQDQDIYDVVFEGRIRKLPVVFNLTAINYMQNLTKIFSAVLIHYTGPNKPWIQKRGLKKFMSNLDLRQPYYSKYEKVLNHEN